MAIITCVLWYSKKWIVNNFFYSLMIWWLFFYCPISHFYHKKLLNDISNHYLFMDMFQNGCHFFFVSKNSVLKFILHCIYLERTLLDEWRNVLLCKIVNSQNKKWYLQIQFFVSLNIKQSDSNVIIIAHSSLFSASKNDSVKTIASSTIECYLNFSNIFDFTQKHLITTFHFECYKNHLS